MCVLTRFGMTSEADKTLFAGSCLQSLHKVRIIIILRLF